MLEGLIPSLGADNYLIKIELFKKYAEAFNNNLEDIKFLKNLINRV